jgi:REP element-mobilizing transposase RayT
MSAKTQVIPKDRRGLSSRIEHPPREEHQYGLQYCEQQRNKGVGQHFWARGYFVSTVRRDTEVIREYIKKQEEEDKRLEQMNLWR